MINGYFLHIYYLELILKRNWPSGLQVNQSLWQPTKPSLINSPSRHSRKLMRPRLIPQFQRLIITSMAEDAFICLYEACMSAGSLRGIHYQGWDSLTHVPLDKMVAFSQMIISDAFSWMKNFVFWLKFKFVSKDPVDNIPALVWIMAWCWKGDKPLSEPMLTRFTDAYMQH